MRLLMLAPIAVFFCLAPLVPGPVSPEPAWSASGSITEIRVLKNVAVMQKEVTLAEICDGDKLPPEWKGLMGSLNIGDAPPAGSEKYIDPGQLRAYLVRLIESQGLDPAQVKLEIPDKVIVRRDSTRLTQEQIEEIFKKFISENSPWKQHDVTVQRVHFSGLPVIPSGVMTYEVNASPKERYIGNVTVTVDFFVNGEKVRTLGVAGRVEVFGNVYLASRPLKQNEMLSAADLTIQKVNVTESVDRFATRPDQVENRRVLRNVGMNQPLELKDLDKPLVLKRGDPVMIVYDQPGLMVTAKGQVNANAGIGDNLAVTNVASKKTVHCKVLDGQTVRAAY
ncbi:MAG: flagellar basal body P-ring formation chaperone FlgA [Desulfobacteraceae bacterium]|nr:flagellar basal body P-ring formation chaperone FlgA [Desulfobacteraceae bacterium]